MNTEINLNEFEKFPTEPGKLEYSIGQITISDNGIIALKNKGINEIHLSKEIIDNINITSSDGDFINISDSDGKIDYNINGSNFLIFKKTNNLF